MSEWLLIGLRQRLDKYIKEEAYEEAAKIRDQIQSLEDEQSGSGAGPSDRGVSEPDKARSEESGEIG